MPLTRSQPRKMSLAACISSLADHDAPAVVAVRALAEKAFQDRGLRLLRLEEQGIPVVAADQQVDPGARADAADADDLARGVDVLELLDRVVVVGERAPVLG